MPNFTYRWTQFRITRITGDTQIGITGYLADASNVGLTSTSGALDTLEFVTQASALPLSNYVPYLQKLATAAFNSYYTSTFTGQTAAGSPIVSSVSSTQELVPGLNVIGNTGIASGTSVLGIPTSTTILLSQSAQYNGQISLTLNTSGWSYDFSALNYFGTVINFSEL